MPCKLAWFDCISLSAQGHNSVQIWVTLVDTAQRCVKGPGTVALPDDHAIDRAVPVEAQLRLPGEVGRVAHAVVLEALQQVARVHVGDDQRVYLCAAPLQCCVWSMLD